MVADRALFIGRFQPFHYGHLHALRWIMEREREVVVAVGSAQFSHSYRNPFTAGERIEMIAAALKEEGLWDRVIVASVPDTEGKHSLWVQLVVSLCPSFKRVYTNEPLTRLLFEESGFEVIAIPFFKREVFEGTKIRALMAEGGDWRSFVPSAVAKVIDDIRGAERVSYLFQIEGKSKTIQKAK